MADKELIAEAEAGIRVADVLRGNSRPGAYARKDVWIIAMGTSERAGVASLSAGKAGSGVQKSLLDSVQEQSRRDLKDMRCADVKSGSVAIALSGSLLCNFSWSGLMSQ